MFDNHLNFAGRQHVTITAVRLCCRGRVNPAATVSSQDLSTAGVVQPDKCISALSGIISACEPVWPSGKALGW